MSVLLAPVRPPRPALRPEERPVSVRRGFGWTLSGYATYMLCQGAILLVLARAGSRDLRDVATFSIALATTTPVFLFFSFGLRRAFATDAASEYSPADYIKLRIWTTVGALAVIGALVALLRYPAETALATLALAGAKSIEAVSDLIHGYFQRRRRIDLSARGTIARGVLSLAGFAAVFALTRNVAWAVVGMGAAWAVVVFGYEWPQAVRLARGAAPSPGRTLGGRRLAIVTLPLGIVALGTSLKASIPVFIIEDRLGVTVVALFTAMIYFHHAVNRVASALGEASAERLAALHEAGDRPAVIGLLGRLLGATLAIAAAAVIAALVVGGKIVELLYGSRFEGLGEPLAIVLALAAAAHVQTILDYALVSFRRFRALPFLYGGGAALLLVLSLAWVPSKGLLGAAMALGVASLAEAAVSIAIIARSLPLRKRARA